MCPADPSRTAGPRRASAAQGVGARRRLWRRGTAAAEFAILAPILALLIFATVDLVLYMRAQVKTEGAAVQVGQVVSQCRQISNPGDMTDFWLIAQTVLGNLADVSASGAGTVIVSAVFSNAAGSNRVAWQQRSNSRFNSAIGSAGGAATIPAGYVVPNGQVLIVTEVFAPARPWVLSAALMNTGVLPQTLRSASLYLSRAPDPTTVSAVPVNNANRVCMA